MLLIFQDFKDRLISLSGLLILMGLSVVHTLMYSTVRLYEVLMNFGYLVIIFTTGFLVVRLRGKLMITKTIGGGDVLFMLVIVWWMNFLEFVVWFNITLCVSILLHLIFSKLSFYKDHTSVPLVGTMSICLLPALWM